jgi:hypothetical protein
LRIAQKIYKRLMQHSCTGQGQLEKQIFMLCQEHIIMRQTWG